MVGVCSKRCSHDSCTKVPTFNVAGTKKAAYCKQHAQDGMVDVRTKRCSNESCTKYPSFNVEGSKSPVYCRQHASDSMVDVVTKRCSHDSCTRAPCFNLEGSKKGAYCSQHAKIGMVDVRNKRCSHKSCLRRPSWGVVTDGTATTCGRHKGDLLGSQAVNFESACKVARCKKRSRWGLDGKQPTHCPDHGPLQEGLVCTVWTDRAQGGHSRKPSYRPVGAPSFRVKAETSF